MSELQELRAEVGELRVRVEEAEAWANGIQSALLQVLPYLLRGHPEAAQVHRLLQRADARFEELQAHPERAEGPDETAGLHEAATMLNRTLGLLGVWPGVEPRAAADAVLGRVPALRRQQL